MSAMKKKTSLDVSRTAVTNAADPTACYCYTDPSGLPVVAIHHIPATPIITDNPYELKGLAGFRELMEAYQNRRKERRTRCSIIPFIHPQPQCS